MNNIHTMEPNLTFNVNKPNIKENDIVDFKCKVKDWHYLESFFSATLQTISFFRWTYVRPADKFMTRVIITVGEWSQKSSETNKYFVRISKAGFDYDRQSLYKMHTFDSAQSTVTKLAEKTNEMIEKNDWETKYPEIERFGPKPTEMELEEMSPEERSKYPEKILFG